MQAEPYFEPRQGARRAATEAGWCPPQGAARKCNAVAGRKTAPPGEKIVCVNKKARYEYEILETLEGGLALTGTEVKSLRAGQASITEGFAAIFGNEAWLVDCQIQPYAFGNLNNHEPKRRRKILLHRREIAKLTGKIKEKGLSLIPLKIYFKNGLAKVEIGVGRGKKLHDKRETIKRRDTERETRREMSVKVRV